MTIGLGTVQFGLNYGLPGNNARTPAGEVRAILDTAVRLGVGVIDTAASYGDSEETLGTAWPAEHGFSVVTKTVQFRTDSIGQAEETAFADGLERSFLRLKLPKVQAVLFHWCGDLLVPGGERLFTVLRRYQQEGRVGKLGASVYTAEDIDRLLDRYPIEIVQLPCSILDQRLLHSGHLRRLKAAGVEIHARSVFLQGVLLRDPETLPPYFAPLRPYLSAWHRAVTDSGTTPLGAALAFVERLVEVDVALAGVRSAAQLLEAVATCRAAPSSDWSGFAVGDPAFLNPALWQLK